MKKAKNRTDIEERRKEALRPLKACAKVVSIRLMFLSAQF